MPHVITEAFYPLFLTVSSELSISFHLVRCRGLVEGLYLFTLYALPLTTLRVAFGSDFHAVYTV
jgi:hypothetical protein